MMLFKSNQKNALLPIEETGEFEGYASIFNVKDAHLDVVRPGAFRKSLQRWTQEGCLPKMLWQHDPTQIIGIWHVMKEDDLGLYVKGTLLLELAKAREVYTLLKRKALDSLSIGYTLQKATKGQHRGSAVHYLEELDVMEVSLVTFPSNGQSKIAHVKSVPSAIRDVEVFCAYLNSL